MPLFNRKKGKQSTSAPDGDNDEGTQEKKSFGSRKPASELEIGCERQTARS